MMTIMISKSGNMWEETLSSSYIYKHRHNYISARPVVRP